MRHDWIFDVLSDLQAYAERNGLPELAQKIAETLTLAEREINGGEVEELGEAGLAPRFRSARRAH
jgi:hypothetical protein